MSVARVELTESGNLVLFDRYNRSVWQSFKNPTDVLVPGQFLRSGGNSLTSQGGGYTLQLTRQRYLSANIKSNPPMEYFSTSNFTFAWAEVTNESFPRQVTGMKYDNSSFIKYVKLQNNGHVTFHSFKDDVWNVENVELFEDGNGCRYPSVCGKFGVCSNGGHCSCPKLGSGKQTLFESVVDVVEEKGCAPSVQITCGNQDDHTLLELQNVTYFPFANGNLPSNIIRDTSQETCKQSCLIDCACKAAMFGRYESTDEFCYLPTEVFSLIKRNEPDPYYETLKFFIKVQTEDSGVRKGSRVRKFVLFGSTTGGLIGIFLFVYLLYIFRLRKSHSEENDEEEYLDSMLGMSVRFSYQHLKSVTLDFSAKLGQGGFGSVYEGAKADGTKIAVKKLDGLIHIKKSFLAEVETIGTIHHTNLVELVGFCADKSNRLLVYEYMQNGSLDKWIFDKKQEDDALDWKTRKRIMVDSARGLAYLHGECRQKIIHLDIKTQNILLDEDFNAKVSDFGLSKLIDRNQSRVMTAMRGTPGYMAPEWLSSVITEKIDVYSFGVVTLEILTGRRNLDSHQPKDEEHFLSLFEKKAQENDLVYLVDKYSEDMQVHRAEVVEMMKVAAWCLQGDFAKRPSMSIVVKVLEGAMDVVEDIEYSFTNFQVPRGLWHDQSAAFDSKKFCSVPPPSLLSAPR